MGTQIHIKSVLSGHWVDVTATTLVFENYWFYYLLRNSLFLLDVYVQTGGWKAWHEN